MKLLLIDVDGTLCSPTKNEPPASAVKAIRAAREKGHLAYICTGRSKAEVYEDIWAIGLDGMIGGNGCFVEDHGKMIRHQKLSLDECTHVVDWCRERNMEFYLECNSGLYPSEKYKEIMCARYKARTGRDISYGVFFERMTYGASPYRDDVNKISFLLNSWEDYLAAQKEFPELFVGYWGGMPPKSTHGDVSPQNVNKANAVRFLQEYLNISKADTISFGDAMVDLPMFAESGYSVAMGSGEQGCKDAADYVTTATDDDGLYNAFIHLGLIDPE